MTLGIEHVGELKKCVGIYVVIPNGPDAGSLTDKGWRFYLDPVEHEIFAAVADPRDQNYLNNMLADLKARSEALNPETFLEWCLGYANQYNILGTLRCFADPTVVRNGALDPASQSISDALYERGM